MSFRIDQLAVLNLATVGNSITAGSFVRSGGTSSQFLKADGSVDSSAYITGITSGMVTTALGYTPVPTTRTLTINGVAQDLSTDRSWTISAGVSSVSGSGAGISVSPTTGAVVVSNTGVTSNLAGTGISVSGATGAVTITNTGVTSIVAGTGISISGATGAVTVTNAGVTSVNGSSGAITGIATTAQLASYLPLAGGTMTGVITTPNGTHGIIVGDDSRLADRNIANTLFVEGVQNNDRGYINFSSTTGNALGAINAGSLTWRGDVVLTSANYNSYAPTLTGTGASGSWGISITGNSATTSQTNFTTLTLNSATVATQTWVTSQGYITSASVGNGTLTLAVAGTGLTGSASFTANQSGNTTFTVTSNATSANTASTIVARDASSNFTASRITTSGLYGPSTSGGNIPIWQYDSANTGYGIVYVEGATDSLRIDVSGQALTGTPDLLVTPDTLQINGNTVLHAGNFNSYAPTLAGTGAFGTWSINITGDAGSVDGYSASTSILGTHIVVRDPNGYIFGNYINMTDDGNPGGGTAITSFITKQGDNYYRSVSPTNAMVSIRSVASGSWGINITGTAGSETLGTVTGRGSSTGTFSTFSGGLSVSSSTLYFRGSNTERIQGEGWAMGIYGYNNNDGFLFYQRDTADAAHPCFHIGGWNNASYGGWSNADSLITLVRGDGTNTTGPSYAYRGLSNSSYYSNIVKTVSSTIFKDSQGLHEFVGSVNINGSGVQPLVLTTNSNGPWALNLYRSDLVSSTRVFNNGGYWYFEHRPMFNGNWALDAGNYNSYSPTLTGGGASGTWGINITGNAGYASSAGSADVLNTFFLGTGSMNTSAGSSRILRVDGGSGAAVQYSPLFHAAASDTMWQIQGTYGTSGDGILYFRQGYAGSWGNWLTMLSSSNFSSYAVPLRTQSNWNDATSVIGNVVGLLAWKEYQNNHVIFDASDGTSPSGTSINSVNSQIAWSNTYPTLMGWNGANTYGVRVDRARLADSANYALSATQVVSIQDSVPPTALTGELWWESDTGRLKLYNGIAAAWVDAMPIPDMSIYYPKAGGPIYGDVSIQQTLNVVGNVLIQGFLTETSDASLKENVVSLEGSLDKVMKLKGVSFNKKITPHIKEVGFIAQEVEAVIPELVTETDQGIKTVSYSRVAAVLVETIKEQQSQIDELKDLLNKLILGKL